MARHNQSKFYAAPPKTSRPTDNGYRLSAQPPWTISSLLALNRRCNIACWGSKATSLCASLYYAAPEGAAELRSELQGYCCEQKVCRALTGPTCMSHSSEAFAAFIESEVTKYTRFIRDAGIKVE